jgi:CheY-like chemotaxis protein
MGGAMDKKKKLLKISEIANEAGVLPSTIRYYTDLGLLIVKGETPGGHRLYDRESTLSAIRKIQFLNKQGHTMEDIKRELSASKKKKILVIDDEPETGDIITELVKLKFPEDEVRVVCDGFTAGRVLGEYLPDLIILDLMLPGVNGFEVCRQIRESKFLEGVKILSITGYDSPEHRQRIMDCGANDYLAKPMDLKVLTEKISQLLKQKTIIPQISI